MKSIKYQADMFETLQELIEFTETGPFKRLIDELYNCKKEERNFF